MANIYEDKTSTQRTLVARECDVCGFIERSSRNAIRFDHDSDYRWAKMHLSLNDYINANNNKDIYACSEKCLIGVMKAMSNLYTHKNDCLGGIPLMYIKSIVGKNV